MHDSTNGRIQRTVEKYFDIRAGEGGPLLDELETRHLSGGDWLMRQGEAGDALYLLVQGRLQAWTGDVDGGAEQKFLGEIVPGDSVGEVSLLTGKPRSASIQAIRDSLLVKISRGMFEKLVHQHPALVLKLASNVASVLHQSTAGTQAAVRSLNTITLLPLDHSPRVRDFCRQLEKELKTYGPVLNLSPGSLGHKGAPMDCLAEDEKIPEELRRWLNDQEYEYRLCCIGATRPIPTGPGSPADSPIWCCSLQMPRSIPHRAPGRHNLTKHAPVRPRAACWSCCSRPPTHPSAIPPPGWPGGRWIFTSTCGKTNRMMIAVLPGSCRVMLRAWCSAPAQFGVSPTWVSPGRCAKPASVSTGSAAPASEQSWARSWPWTVRSSKPVTWPGLHSSMESRSATTPFP